MTAAVVRRLLQAVMVMFAMTVIVFIAINVIGDPVDILISPDADQIERARVVQALGLDLPLWQQYLRFLWAALHGDLGESYVYNEPAI
ncbi:MAG: ABC transporter permease, partial [Mesorhizobium sp.]